jgi:antitoxin VapB
MIEATRGLRKGVTEEGIAGELSRSLWSRGVLPAVLLVAGDDRQLSYRHPIPTGLPIQKHAMIVVCGNYKGLILSLTRHISFGPAPVELQKKQESSIRVEMAMWKSSIPGASSDAVFEAAKKAYAAEGYPSEELKHHQGGAAGYDPRDWLGGVDNRSILAGEALAWNPSISGAKSEDTILCAEDGRHEILTDTPGWPNVTVNLDGTSYQRPGFLVL